MGFRTGSFCTIWSVEPVKDTRTKARISISKRNRDTGEYETDFSGFVDFIGTAAASKGAKLKERDRIKLGDVDVSNRYDKGKNITYTNFKIFSFDGPDELDGSAGGNKMPTDSDGFMKIPDGSTDELPF